MTPQEARSLAERLDYDAEARWLIENDGYGSSRIVARDVGPDILAALDTLADTVAPDEPEAEVRQAAAETRLDVERLARALELTEINCWTNPFHHRPDDADEHRQHRIDAEAIAREYARLGRVAQEVDRE